MNKETVLKITGVKENFQVPDALLKIVLDEKKRKIAFDKVLKKSESLESDLFLEYFQTGQSDRKGFMQDFTPCCVGEIVARLAGSNSEIKDVCAGTGSLSVANWKNHKEAKIVAYELSDSALPFLLFNLAIRNIDGCVVHGDVLTGEIKGVYKLASNLQYSDILKIDHFDDKKSEIVITNPPYSLPFDFCNFKNDDRFKEFGIPPKAKADFGFVLHSLSLLNEKGASICILPHGVLFRGQKEGVIRKKLIDNNLLDTVIGLPDKLFLNTSIPVCLLVFKKSRTVEDVYFIDASKEFEKEGKQNRLSKSQIERVCEAYRKRTNIEKYARLVSIEEIKENEYNLNIPRYVDTFEEEPVPDLEETLKSLLKTKKEIKKAEKDLLELMGSLRGTSEEEDVKLQREINLFKEYVGGLYD